MFYQNCLSYRGYCECMLLRSQKTTIRIPTAEQDTEISEEKITGMGGKKDAAVVVTSPEPGPKTTTSTDHASPSATLSKEEESRFEIKKIFFNKPKLAGTAAPLNQNQPLKAKNAPPPIVIPHNGEQEKQQKLLEGNLLNRLKRGVYLISHLRTATSIKATNLETRSLIEKFLNENNIGYYSYANDPPKLKKYVLYGLNTQPIADIIADLRDYGLIPVDIKMMKIRNPRYYDHQNYIVYFDAVDRVTLDMLTQARYICNTKVTWGHFRSPENKCTQCQNCFRYNHIALNCKMHPVCYLCAGTHGAEKCPLIIEKAKMKADRIPDSLLKCCNCGGTHTAVFQHCPARIIQLKNKTRPPPNSKPTPKVQFQPAEFPKINFWTKKSSTEPQTPREVRRSTEEPGPTPTTTKPKQQSSRVQRINNRIEKPVINRVIVNETDDLFTPQQLMNVFREMLEIMRGCRSRADQLSALMDLTLKYLQCRG